jgi:hypothetical protein
MPVCMPLWQPAQHRVCVPPASVWHLPGVPPQVKPLFYTREAYKTAAHALTQRDFTPEHRANTEALLKVGKLLYTSSSCLAHGWAAVDISVCMVVSSGPCWTA